MAKSKRAANATIAKVAGAAAAAAVRAERQSDVLLNWGEGIDEDDDSAAQVLEDLERIDDDAGGEITWELYCDTPIEKAGQIRKLARSELRSLRDECLALGPGQYHVIARDGDTGAFVKKSRRNIKISGFARPTATPAATPGLDPMSLFQQLDERAQRRRQEELAERNSQIRFWAPILAPIGLELAKNLFGNRSGGGESIKDLVAALVSMRELTGGNDKTLDTLMKGFELARDLQPDAKGSTWPDMLTTIAKELRPVAEALGARKQGNGVVTAQVPSLPQASLPPMARPPEGAAAAAEVDTVFDLVVKPLLERLAAELEEFATNGADPGLTAEALLAKVPRVMRAQVTPAQLKEWLSQPNWWELTVQFRQTLQPYQGYCDDVRLALLEMTEREIAGETGDPEAADA